MNMTNKILISLPIFALAGCQASLGGKPIDVLPLSSKDKIKLTYPVKSEQLDSMTLVCDAKKQGAFIMFNSKEEIKEIKYSDGINQVRPLSEGDFVKGDNLQTKYIAQTLNIKTYNERTITAADAFGKRVLESVEPTTIIINGNKVTLNIKDSGELQNFISQCSSHPDASKHLTYLNPNKVESESITHYQNKQGAEIVRLPFPSKSNTGIKAMYSFCQKTTFDEFENKAKYVSGLAIEYNDQKAARNSSLWIKGQGNRSTAIYRPMNYDNKLSSPVKYFVGHGFDFKFSSYKLNDFSNGNTINPFESDSIRVATTNIANTPYNDVVNTKGFMQQAQASYDKCQSN
ncbi:hypothetical protein [Vibrio mediterranei]|uniref:hypothetical protein n=1 Tax=Vibrio mediterranei TaxID=689 RepID=UPI0005712813|nr:hypothetical protein [Vibrio mediterranei]